MKTFYRISDGVLLAMSLLGLIMYFDHPETFMGWLLGALCLIRLLAIDFAYKPKVEKKDVVPPPKRLVAVMSKTPVQFKRFLRKQSDADIVEYIHISKPEQAAGLIFDDLIYSGTPLEEDEYWNIMKAVYPNLRRNREK